MYERPCVVADKMVPELQPSINDVIFFPQHSNKNSSLRIQLLENFHVRVSQKCRFVAFRSETQNEWETFKFSALHKLPL